MTYFLETIISPIFKKWRVRFLQLKSAIEDFCVPARNKMLSEPFVRGVRAFGELAFVLTNRHHPIGASFALINTSHFRVSLAEWIAGAQSIASPDVHIRNGAKNQRQVADFSPQGYWWFE
jgi:hypothetical protein